MHQWALDGYGRANLRLRPAPVPEAGPGEVLVKVAAVSLNNRDIMMIANGMGASLPFPFRPGSDMAGSIAALGTGATRFSVGDRVISTFMPGWIDRRTAGTARISSYRALGGKLPGVFAEYLVFS